MSLEEMIKTIIKTGYEVREMNTWKAVKAADLFI